MRGQVFCRVGGNTRATDLVGPLGETVGGLKARILGVALNEAGADRLVRSKRRALALLGKRLHPNPFPASVTSSSRSPLPSRS